MASPIAHRLLLGLMAATMTGCSIGNPASQLSVGGSAAGSSLPERQHQDAQVLANVVRADLQHMQSMGVVCENPNSGLQCTTVVNGAAADIEQTLADLQVLRIPAFMKSDTDALIAALKRAETACGPVLANAQNRIPEAYAANEFDTAIRQVLSANAKVSADGN